jgi:hypothetical protein
MPDTNELIGGRIGRQDPHAPADQEGGLGTNSGRAGWWPREFDSRLPLHSNTARSSGDRLVIGRGLQDSTRQPRSAVWSQRSGRYGSAPSATLATRWERLCHGSLSRPTFGCRRGCGSLLTAARRYDVGAGPPAGSAIFAPKHPAPGRPFARPYPHTLPPDAYLDILS